MLCPRCSSERSLNRMEGRGHHITLHALIVVVELEKHSRLSACPNCGAFFLKKHPRLRFEFYSSLPGRKKIKIPEGCLYYAGQSISH